MEKEEVRNRIDVLNFLESNASTRQNKGLLPFHELMSDPWSILEPELTPATVVQLVSMCGPLDLEADEFYMRLMKNMVNQNLKPVKCQNGEEINSGTKSSPKKGDFILDLEFSHFKDILMNLSSIENKVRKFQLF